MIFWTHVIGWTLVHFVWQGATLGMVAAVVLRMLRGSSSQIRYAMACTVLALMVVSPVVTGWSLAQDVTPVVIARQQPVSFTAAETVSAVAPNASGTYRISALIRADVERLLPILVSLWLLGVGCLIARLGIGWSHVRRLHKAALLTAASHLQQTADTVAGRIGLRRLVHIVDSDRIDTPTAIGWLRPVVLVPLAAVTQLTPTQIDAILAHELAHIRRHDYLINLVQNLAEVFLFYHPAVWWLSARIRREREHCCDDIAVSVCGDALLYVSALSQLEHARTTITERVAPSRPALAATGGSLLQRVRRILRVNRDTQRASSSAVFTIAVVAAFVFVVAARDRLNALSPRSSMALQSDAQVSFASASIKSIPVNATNRPFHCVLAPDGRVFKAFGPADWIVACAYGIPATRTQEQLVGGPDWLRLELFEIEAQSPPDHLPASFSEGLPMLRMLLADRFKLAVHRETKHLDTFDLAVARRDGTLGPQMRPTPQDCAAWIASKRKGPMPSRPGYRPCGFARTFPWWLTNTAIAMPQFANLLTLVTGNVVRDMTGLQGFFDVDLQLTSGAGTPPVDRRADVSTALRNQLGLTLEPSTSAVDLLIIDHVEHPETESH